MTLFDPVAHATAVLALLNAVPGLTVYDGEVPTTPPVDSDGRVHPYAVLYAGTATNTRSTLNGASTVFQWPFQVTVVGGDRQRCSWAAGKVTGALVDQRITVTGFTTGLIGHDPGPDLRRDDVEMPPRHYQPLLFSVTSTPA